MIDAMKELQTALDKAGFPPGMIDGKGGPATARALAGLLRSHGLQMDVTATVSSLTARGPVPRAPVAVPNAGGVVTSQPGKRTVYQGSARYLVNEFAVHCSATRVNWMDGATLAAKVAEIKKWHVQPKPHGNGWKDIGYHWIIDRDGSIMAGRPENVIGAGIENRNRGVIHACLIGGHGSSETDRFDRHFTAAQAKTLRDLIGQINVRIVSGHNQYAAKACPGFNVPEWYANAA
jgi:hypothetical protein